MGWFPLGIASSAFFTPAWQSLRLGGGGNLQGMHTYADGTILTHGDVFGGWVYKTSGSATQDGTAYPAPSWQLLVTTDSLPAGDVTLANAYSNNTGVGEIVAAPSNTNVLYMYWNGKTYVSTNRGVSWTNMGFANGLNANGGPVSAAWIAVDPNNPDIVYFMTPSSGLYKTTSGTSASTPTLISGVANANGNGGCICFDATSLHPGNVTQRLVVSVQGTGVYECVNGSTFSAIASGSPPTHALQVNVDKFGQVWACEGFYGASGVYKYASGTWTHDTVSGEIVVSVMFDPNTGASVGSNHVILADNNGQLLCSLDNNATAFVDTTPNPPGSNIFLTATGAQPGWLNVANQYDNTGRLALNLNMAAIDPNTGTVWGATGINTFKTSNPIVLGSLVSSVTWTADTIGQDMLVTNQVISAPGSAPLVAVWDRGVFLCNNPDLFPTSQFPNSNNIASPFSYQDVMGAWSADYVPIPNNTPTAQATFLAVIASQSGGPTILGKSTDGGNNWTLVTQPSTGIGLGGVIAASTAANLAIIPGDFSTGHAVVYFTINGGTAWNQSTFPGSPNFLAFNTGHLNNRQPLVADRVTSGKFYAVDDAQNFYVSTNSGGAFTATGATSASVDGANGRDFLLAVPGNAGHVLYSTGGAGGSHLWKSTNGCGSFAKIPASGAFDTIKGVGFGAPLPGGSGYPTIYAYGLMSGVQGLYQSTDAGVTWTACNLPAGEKLWPFRSMDTITWVSGDQNVYGRVYVGFLASGGCYIDTADACPWVNFSNVNPNAALTGTVTLTAQHSGLVPVTSVQFSVDGVNIGSALTGAGPYSTSWVTGGVATGAHTLTVTAIGANGSGSFSIPITTH